MKTKDRLTAELIKAGVEDRKNEAVYKALAERAITGEFDDYADTYVCPITQLHHELTQAGLTKFADRVAAGEFDATKEESDEWIKSADGQAALAQLPPAMRKMFE